MKKLFLILISVSIITLSNMYSVKAYDMEADTPQSIFNQTVLKREEKIINNENWMKDYTQDDTPIGQLSIPGTHDSAAFRTWGIHSAARPWAVTQDKDVVSQLYMGVRYLDFRTSEDFYMYHGSVGVGQDLITHFKQVIDFLKKHPKEFVIIRLKNEKGSRDRLVERLNREIFNNRSEINRFIYSKNGKILKVGDLRGKILILNDLGSGLKLSTIPYKQVRAQDNYQPYSYEKKFNDIVDFNNLMQNNNELYLNYVSFTYGIKKIENTSRYMNREIFKYLYDNHYDVKNTGVLIFDNINNALLKEIIQRNMLSNRYYITANEIKVSTGTKIEETDLISSINNLPSQLVSSIKFDEIPSTDIPRNVNVIGNIVFIDKTTSKVVIPINIEKNIEDGNSYAENIPISIYRYDSRKNNYKGELKRVLNIDSFRVDSNNRSQRQLINDSDLIIRNFLYEYFDLSGVLNPEKKSVKTLIEYAITQRIEPKEEYKFFLSEPDEITYLDKKIYVSSYYEDGTHILVEIPVCIKNVEY